LLAGSGGLPDPGGELGGPGDVQPHTDLSAELGVSRSAVLKWHRAGLIILELITPGNHLRWDAERVREQLRARRQRDEGR